MTLPFKSQKELYDLWINTLQTEAPQLTDLLDGSVIDALGGVFSIAGTELQRYTVTQFNKTFIELANGPEVTGGPDDLQALAVDHFGDAFARPGATQAIDTVTFSRPVSSVATYGTITIIAGTVVKTSADASGQSQRYATNSTVVLTNIHGGTSTDISISVSVTAVVAGSASNASAGTINVIETALLDPTITCANAGNQTGVDAEDDASYRETIRNLIIALRAATLAAIQGAALAVPGVATAVGVLTEMPVVQYDIATQRAVPGAEFFYIPFAALYIADAGGSASPALIATVANALIAYEAFGVNITVLGANPVTVNWTASLTLNPLGPNYATLVIDTTLVKTSMSNYIASLGVGNSFVRATAEAAMLALFGPSGTNDLTAFFTDIPTSDISIGSTQTAIPGVIATA